MKIILLKKIALFAVIFSCSVTFGDYHVGTRHLQVVINPQDSNFAYYLNGVPSSLFAPRPAGGYYLLSGLIFEKDTVSHKQANFGFSEHGVVLSAANSLGVWWNFGLILSPIAFTPMGFPAKGAVVEMANWEFWFNEKCHERLNSLVVNGGRVTAGTLQPHKVGFKVQAPVTGSTGCTTSANNELKAKIYFGSSFEIPQLLINVEFQNEIVYKKDRD